MAGEELTLNERGESIKKAYVPDEIAKRSIYINADIGEILKQL